MFNNWFLFIEIFIFTMACLNVVKHIYNVVKVLSQHDGKVENDSLSLILFGCSFSYILSTLVVGF